MLLFDSKQPSSVIKNHLDLLENKTVLPGLEVAVPCSMSKCSDISENIIGH
jgi:hypothetical protein